MTIDAINDRLRSRSEDDWANLLFHGTCETIDGPLRPSPFCGVLWCADCPSIAQTYIPESGTSTLYSPGSHYTKDDPIRPSKHSIDYEIALQIMEGCEPEVDWDIHGRAVSWKLPQGWPRKRDIDEHITRLGYELGLDPIWIKEGRRDGRLIILEANYAMPGELYIGLRDGLNLLDVSTGEGSLSNPQHLRLDLFRKAEDAGFDGIIIDDFAQTKRFGNFGHKAIGLFGEASKRMAWISTPATRFEWDGPFVKSTPDFNACVENLRSEIATAPAL